MDLDILEREVPVTEEKPETCKQGQYKIKDNFLAFWFQFVFPYQSFIEGGHPEIVSSRIRANAHNSLPASRRDIHERP